MKKEQEIIKLRNHYTYIFEQLWKWLFVILAFLLGNEESISIGIDLIKKGNIMQGIIAMWGILGVLLILFLWQTNRWYRTTLTIQDGTITSVRATLTRRVNTIAIANISNINMEQNLFERIVGTYRLKIDTNSLSTADITDLELLLKKRDAEKVKHLIFTMLKELRESAAALAEENQEQPVNTFTEQPETANIPDEFDMQHGTYDLAYSFGEIIRSGLVTMSVAELLSAVLMLIFAVITMAAMLRNERDILVIIPTVFVQLLATFSIVANILKKWLMNFNFRAKRYKDKIYVSYVFLKKKEYVVPIDKINAVSVRYSFIGRITKRAVVKVINIGGEGTESDGVQLLLANTYQGLKRKMRVLLPELELPETDAFIKPPRKYVKLIWLYAVLSALLVFFGVSGGCFIGNEINDGMFGRPVEFIGFAVILALVVFILVFLIRYLTYRTAGLFYMKDSVAIVRGVFGKHIQIIPYAKIQFIHQEQGPLQAVLGLMSGYISILAGLLSQVQMIDIFSEKDFLELEKRIRDTY